MTNNEVVDILAKDKTVERIINKISNTGDDQLRDLAQDIYMQLLQDKRLPAMYERNEHLF